MNTRRTVRCTNPECGNTIFEDTYAFDASATDPKPIWRCCNCGRETPRFTRKRKSNRAKAWDVIDQLNAEWKPVDEQLRALVDAGTPSGCLLVHSSTFNWHMEQLRSKDKPTNSDIGYHSAHAREDLERAKAFVAEKLVAQ